jgi:hypothetical protein
MQVASSDAGQDDDLGQDGQHSWRPVLVAVARGTTANLWSPPNDMHIALSRRKAEADNP